MKIRTLLTGAMMFLLIINFLVGAVFLLAGCFSFAGTPFLLKV